MLLRPANQQSEAGAFDINTMTGRTQQEAAQRLVREGYNELPSTRQRTWLALALDIVREPMFMLLIGGGIIYVFLGDVREALILLGSIFLMMGITFYQEQKTERALEALRDLSSPRALVIRGGEQRRIADRKVVHGDLLMLAEGDRVPADGVLLWGINLSVDESLLTGESMPVRKMPGIIVLKRCEWSDLAAMTRRLCTLVRCEENGGSPLRLLTSGEPPFSHCKRYRRLSVTFACSLAARRASLMR